MSYHVYSKETKIAYFNMYLIPSYTEMLFIGQMGYRSLDGTHKDWRILGLRGIISNWSMSSGIGAKHCFSIISMDSYR